MTATAIAGAVIMVATEAATLAHLEPFWSWNTPIAWTGFILFADGVVRRARGDSWLSSSRREFVFLALVSIPLWLVFEWFNLYLRNWYYVGQTMGAALRYFGYAWAYATIWPAIFEGAELIATLRGGRHLSRLAGPHPRSLSLGAAAPPRSAPPPRSGRGRLSRLAGSHPRSLSLGAASLLIFVGALLLTSPLVVPASVASYLAAPVWLGFIFLLDPINDRLGLESLAADWRGGRLDRIVNLALSGLLCGILWEFWNYWARSKWHYTVPIMEHTKLFEMPLPGYLGFPAFALECFTMYVFVRHVAGLHLCRRIGL